jgi:hypothetical protein
VVGAGDGGIGERGVVEKYRTELPPPPPPVFRVRFRGERGDFGEPRGDNDIPVPGFNVLGVLKK